jgi:hypothetical protein
MQLPAMRCVRQKFPTEHISDIEGEVRLRLREAGLERRIQPGMKIAITASSRGTQGTDRILRAVVAEVRASGGEPFLVPAMGSHGGATPEGQRNVLAAEGITEESIGAPIRATMETVYLGTAPTGAEAHFDKNAYEADGTIVLSTVKLHPQLRDDIGSGLCKMTAIGLGKQRGAASIHFHGLHDSLLGVAEITLAKANIILGLASVMNAYRQPYCIEAVPPQKFYEADCRLLEVARKLHPHIPYNALDVLVIDWMGKNITGAGMDPNVIGWWRLHEGPREPNYRRIVTLDLTPESLGNAVGVGLADFITARLDKKIDWNATLINVLTSGEPDLRPNASFRPFVLLSDREAIEMGLRSVGVSNPRVVRIKATNALEEFRISETLLAETQANPRLEVLSEPEPWPFDNEGNLTDL